MAKKILVVDDSASTRQTVALVLERNGYAVVPAVDGIDALKKIAEEPIDLVVTEVRMPNLCGASLVEELRRSERHGTTPVIVLTIEHDLAVRRKMQALGCTDWHEKPFKINGLVASVEKALAAA